MRRRFLLAIALVPLVLVDASPVMAHSDKGRLALQATRAGQPLGVQVRARLVFANDGDPVSTATVTVEATGPNGQTVAPRALASEGDGVYTTVLGLPVAGTWTLRANVLEPEADAEIPFEAVAAPPTTVAATTTTTTTSVPAARADAVATQSTDDGQGGTGWLLVLGGAVLVFALGGAWVWSRARSHANRSTGPVS